MNESLVYYKVEKVLLQIPCCFILKSILFLIYNLHINQ